MVLCESCHIDPLAKAELEAINELLVEGYAGKAAVLLGVFLDNVHVVPLLGGEQKESN